MTTAWLTNDSPRLRGGRVEVGVQVSGTDSLSAALTAAIAEAPESIELFGTIFLPILESATPVFIDEEDGEHPADGFWEISIPYEPPGFGVAEPPKTDEQFESFDIMLAAERFVQSYDHIVYPVPGVTPPDFGGAIGVDDNGEAQGVTLEPTGMRFEITRYTPREFITDAYKGTLFSLLGRVNDAPFRGASTGEALFLGVRGTERPQFDDFEMVYSLAANPNIIFHESVFGIADVAKGGHEYLEAYHRKVNDDSATPPRIVPELLAVVVHQVRLFGDFSQLLIL